MVEWIFAFETGASLAAAKLTMSLTVMDKTGNLYGTTIYGGSGCGCGVVYRLAPNTKGK